MHAAVLGMTAIHWLEGSTGINTSVEPWSYDSAEVKESAIRRYGKSEDGGTTAP